MWVSTLFCPSHHAIEDGCWLLSNISYDIFQAIWSNEGVQKFSDFIIYKKLSINTKSDFILILMVFESVER